MVDRIQRLPNVEVLLQTEVRELLGDESLEAIVVGDNRTGERRILDARAMFVFIGVQPHARWLGDQLALDEQGFILTGADAAGDVRSGSIKRVAAAVGEGSMAVRLVHQYLEQAGVPRHEEAPSMPVTGVDRFERFFRAAGLDVDKDDLRRYRDFVNRKLYDLLVIGQAAAKANGRDIIEPSDLPITRGLQEGIQEFEQLDEEVELQPILDDLAMLPQLDLAPSVDTEARFPVIVGGLSLALARALKLLDPKVKNPRSEHWDRAFRLFDLLL
jgi:Domain of unknown function (DUF1931)